MQTPQSDSLQTVICGRCATVCDLDDNFCRQCGMVLSDQRLPLRRDTRVPATWQPRVRAAALRGVAVLAAGTLAELAARRLVRGAARRVANVTRLPLRGRGADVAQKLDDEDGGAQLVSDTLFVRRLRVKR